MKLKRKATKTGRSDDRVAKLELDAIINPLRLTILSELDLKGRPLGLKEISQTTGIEINHLESGVDVLEKARLITKQDNLYVLQKEKFWTLLMKIPKEYPR